MGPAVLPYMEDDMTKLTRKQQREGHLTDGQKALLSSHMKEVTLGGKKRLAVATRGAGEATVARSLEKRGLGLYYFTFGLFLPNAAGLEKRETLLKNGTALSYGLRKARTK
jgi:hypothetical protein